MKLSKGVENFWTQIGLIFLHGAVAALIAFALFGWIAASLAAAIGVLWIGWFLHETKSKLVQGHSGEWNIKTVNLEDVPSIDLGWIQRQTTVLESLGFVWLMDYELLEYPQTFGRCFAHPQQYCFAEIGHLPEGSGTESLKNLSIFSLLDESWRLAVTNRQPRIGDSLVLLWHNPKSIAICDPNPSLEQVFQNHLRSRQQVLTDLGITLSTDVSWDAYAKLMQHLMIQIKQSLRQRNLLVGMIKATLYELSLKPDWFLGDYPTLAAKRRTRNR
ncbi:hypothetical protein K9N68_22340 [Kovacikia minuta CCNUW1]|uniref:hypothetical protein n=1 Tax=Kovacikia minuta TaxID=2931930 RepID=UPI001CD00A8F|nr:hypothetical protein [Kovacikia minuta]UBF24420.1 hypothetical protein K9N68_22340 [Kovacikia minuta CCNUW1]